MKYTYICLFCSVLLITGCVNRIPGYRECADITFNTSLSQEQIPIDGDTRSITDNISSLSVFDCMDGEKMQEVTQSSSDKDFGSVSMTMSYGTHELLFVGYKSEGMSFFYPSITFPKVLDTFSYSLKIDVDEDSQKEQNIVLSRSVALVKVTATDAITADVAALRMTLSACYPSLDVTTSYSSGIPEKTARTFNYQPSNIGAKGSTYSIYTFVPDGGFTTDVTVETLNSQGKVINTSLVKSVSVEKNRQTILSGNLFNHDATLDISLDTSWGANIEYPI